MTLAKEMARTISPLPVSTIASYCFSASDSQTHSRMPGRCRRTKGPEFTLRYARLPVAFALVDQRGLPVWAPTLFLASHSVRSRGVSSDTRPTYGELLIAWLRRLSKRLSPNNGMKRLCSSIAQS